MKIINAERGIYRILQGISVILFSWIILMLSCGNYIEFICKKTFLLPNIFLVFISIGLFDLLNKFIKCKEKYEKRIDLILKIFSICFLVIQIFNCYNIFFETGWDSGNFIVPAAKDLLEQGTVSDIRESYFSLYPNNIFLVNIFYIILKINNTLNIFQGQYQLMTIVVCNCVISSITCWLVYLIGKKRLRVTYAVIGYGISIVLIGISPWSVICYSDPIALLFPVLILYIYLEEKINVYIKWISILVLGYLGYCIKPQVVIILIAIILIELIQQFGNVSWKKIGKIFLVASVSILLIGFIAVGMKEIYANEGFIQDQEQSVGLAHYFMMGLNQQTGGVYSEEDAKLSERCESKVERNEKNIQIARIRLNEKGFVGYLKFLSKKILINYDDGTFAWGEEGGFYNVKTKLPNSTIAPLLRNIYYNDGKYFCLYASIVQGIWLLVVFGCWLVSVKEMRKKKINKTSLIMLVTLIGITLFELLFEARARYIYIYVPIYILLAEQCLEK